MQVVHASSHPFDDDAGHTPSARSLGVPFLRPRLQALADQPHAHLIVFCAPPGSGKTMALRGLMARRLASGHGVAWLSVEAADDKPPRFFRRLLRCLALSLPELAALADAGEARTPEEWAEGLLSVLAQRPQRLLLVLDDLHWVTHPGIHAALDVLVRSAPSGFTVAVGSRVQPPLSLATFRAKDCLLEFGAEELRLSLDELRDYLGHSGLCPDEQTLAGLHGRTEGWVTGVRLACHGSPRQSIAAHASVPFTVEHAAMGDYLRKALFERLTAGQQEALTALSVARRFNGELAGVLTGQDDGQPLLESLERSQTFLVPLDRERGWYRFHQSFAEFLQARLKATDPERHARLHARASQWFLQQRWYEPAIEHAYRAGDPERLAVLLDGSAWDLIGRQRMGPVRRWLKAIPEPVAERFHRVLLVDIWSRAAELGLSRLTGSLEALLLRWTSASGPCCLDEGGRVVLLAEALVALQKDDPETCILLATRAEARFGGYAAFLETTLLLAGALAHVSLGQPESARRLLGLARQRGHFLEGTYLEVHLGNVEVLLALEQGRMRLARQLLLRLASGAGGFSERGASGEAPLALSGALLAYHEGRREGLETNLREALERFDPIVPLDLQAQGMLTLARIQRQAGRQGEALLTLRRLQNLALRQGTWRFHLEALAEEITMMLQEGWTDACTQAEARLAEIDWERRAAPYESRGFNPVRWLRGLIRVRLRQARGQHREALQEIARLRERLLVFWHGVFRLRLDVLAAHSEYRLGYSERGRSLLTQALQEAERENIRGLWFEEGDACRGMLLDARAVEHRPALQGFLSGLLADWPEGAQAPTSAGKALTERERSLLALVAEGLTNQAIAQRLSLTLGTVKWHLHNIYKKLGVRNRGQAIRRLRAQEAEE